MVLSASKLEGCNSYILLAFVKLRKATLLIWCIPLYIFCIIHKRTFAVQHDTLTLNLLTTTIVAPPSNASKWQMGFNSAFKGLMSYTTVQHVWFIMKHHHALPTYVQHYSTTGNQQESKRQSHLVHKGTKTNDMQFNETQTSIKAIPKIRNVVYKNWPQKEVHFIN